MFAGTALAVKPPKAAKKEEVHSTRSTDKNGRPVDYIRHEPCKGHGCNGCKGYGFTKQYVLA